MGAGSGEAIFHLFDDSLEATTDCLTDEALGLAVNARPRHLHRLIVRYLDLWLSWPDCGRSFCVQEAEVWALSSSSSIVVTSPPSNDLICLDPPRRRAADAQLKYIFD